MKTYNDLFDKIVDEENIRLAITRAARGKRRKATVRKALKNIDGLAAKLSAELKAGTWRPLPIHRTKEINDGIELKKRFIVCPNFATEQCVHHAIMQICDPLFRRKFYRYSCGSVKKNGAEVAKEYVKKMTQRYPAKTKYVAKLDIRKFFHNAKPSFIFREIRKTIRDRRVLGLFALILRANVQIINGVPVKGGIPIGFYTSPQFANILLNFIDHKVKEEWGIEVYVRYMDDMLLFSANRRKLKKVCLLIEKEINALGMQLKPVWQVHKFQAINFLGFQFKRDTIRMRDKIFLKAVRLFKRVRAKVKLTIHDCLRVLSYAGRFKKADTHSVFMKYVSGYINIRELRKRVSKVAKKGALNGI